MNQIIAKTVIYCDRLDLNIGTRINPALYHITRGQRDDSFVYHTKEDRKYYQYHKLNINKKSINLQCMYARRKKCTAQLTITANKDGLIKKGEGVQRNRFFMAKEIVLDEKSAQDWSVKLDSGKNEHSEFCTNQVPLAKRPRMEENAEENATPSEIRSHNQQWCRFGQGQPLARAFRHTQTRTAIIQKTCQIKHVENAWKMNENGGARLLEIISDSKNI